MRINRKVATLVTTLAIVGSGGGVLAGRSVAARRSGSVGHRSAARPMTRPRVLRLALPLGAVVLLAGAGPPAHAGAGAGPPAHAGARAVPVRRPRVRVSVIATGLDQPKKLTIAANGDVVVALSGDGSAPSTCTDGDQSACIDHSGAVDEASPRGRVRIDQGGGARTVLVSRGLDVPTGLAVGAGGAVYVSVFGTTPALRSWRRAPPADAPEVMRGRVRRRGSEEKVAREHPR